MNIEIEAVMSFISEEVDWLVENFKDKIVSVEEHERLIHILKELVDKETLKEQSHLLAG